MDNHYKKSRSQIVHLIQTKSIKEAQILIENSMSPSELNIANKHGVTPLIASIINSDTSLIKLLIKKCADINLSDSRGLTPLMYAVFERDFNLCELLLKNGANLNAVDKNNNTALIFSIMTNQLFLVDYFLKKGANIYLINLDGNTALDIAKNLNFISILYHLLNFLTLKERNDLKIINFDWNNIIKSFRLSLNNNAQLLYDNMMPTIHIYPSDTFYCLPLELIHRIMSFCVLAQDYSTWYVLRAEEDLQSTYDFICKHKKRPTVLFSSTPRLNSDNKLKDKETDLNIPFSQLTIFEPKSKAALYAKPFL